MEPIPGNKLLLIFAFLLTDVHCNDSNETEFLFTTSQTLFYGIIKPGVEFERKYVQFIAAVKVNIPISGLTFDNKRRMVFVAANEGSICRGMLYQNLSCEPLNLGIHIHSVAFDWVTDNLYLIDSLFCQILACDKNINFCATVYHKIYPCGNSLRLRYIVLNPEQRSMFWTESGSKNVKSGVWTASMDGSSPKCIVFDDIVFPTGFALNNADGRLYWADGIKKTIETCLPNGSDRRVVHSFEMNVARHVLLDVFENNLIWAVNDRKSLVTDVILNEEIHRTSPRVLYKQEWTVSRMHIVNVDVRSVNPSNPCAGAKCSHICTLTQDDLDSYKCFCPKHMKLLNDSATCVTAQLFEGPIKFAYHTNSITLYGVYNGLDELQPLSNITNANISDAVYTCIDARNGLIYGVEEVNDEPRVFQYNLINGERTKIADKGFRNVVAIAFDWIVGNIYVLDSHLAAIVVCNNKSRACSVVLPVERGSEGSLEVDPIMSYMYWTSNSSTNYYSPVIWRAGLDGSDSKPLITDGLSNPVQLRINYEQRRLFWLDENKQTIESCGLDGSNQTIVLDSFGFPTIKTFNLVQNKIVLHHTYQKNFWVFDVSNGAPRTFSHYQTTFGFENTYGDEMSLDIIDERNQPMGRKNPCLASVCSHICVQTPNLIAPFRCLCPSGMTLDHDNVTCKDDSYAQTLIIAYKNIVKLMTMDIIGKDVYDIIILPSSITTNVIVFNPIQNSLILHDATSLKILSYDIIQQQVSTVAEGTDSITGITIDVISQNIYWVDSQAGTIQILSLSTLSQKNLTSGFKNAQDIIAVPELGVLYVAQKNERIGLIWKLTMAGEFQSYYTSSENSGPTFLFYDRYLDELYWVDELTQEIKKTTNEGTDIEVSSINSTVTGIVVFGNTMFWSLQYSKDISVLRFIDDYWIKMEAAEHTPSFPIKLALLDSNLTIFLDLLNNHDCSVLNHKLSCSHICIPAGKNFTGRCECPTEMILNDKGNVCLDCTKKQYAKLCKNHANGTSANQNDAPHLSTRVIVAASVAVVAVVGIFLAIIFVLGMRMRRKDQIISDFEIREFQNGRETGYGNARDDHIFCAKYKEEELEIGEFEFAKESSTIIGGGNFGVVYKSYLARYNSEVAVKSPKSAVAEEIKSVLCEIKILSFVGEHPNIVRLLGAYSKELAKGSVLVVMELCHNGSLLNHLRGIAVEISKIDIVQSLFQFCEEISSGMEYLAQKTVVHGDLSARNILLDENFKCKICDFGLSRKVERYATYIKQTHEPLPWRWLAVESLSTLEFTLKSDIWSIGVTFWEIFTLGKVPFVAESCSLEFIEKLKNGFRLSKPELLSNEEFEMILQCWNLDPVARPDAKALRQFCGSQIKQYIHL